MNLLRKWWAPIRARLIGDASNWHRFWSVRLAALGAAIEAFITWFPDQAREAWTYVPPDARAMLPTWLTASFPIVLFGAVIVSRLVAQKKVEPGG